MESARGDLERVLSASLDSLLVCDPSGRIVGVNDSLCALTGYDRRDLLEERIEDNGIGIAPEHHRLMFGLGERLHPAEEYPGTGMGLALVGLAAERMGGRVGLEFREGEGSAFWVELPRAPASRPLRRCRM